MAVLRAGLDAKPRLRCGGDAFFAPMGVSVGGFLASALVAFSSARKAFCNWVLSTPSGAPVRPPRLDPAIPLELPANDSQSPTSGR